MSPVLIVNSQNTLRSRQIAAIRQLINQNEPVSESIAAEPVWKVLIFDSYGQDVLSPILSVKELRDLGVTLHLNLESIRESLPDVPAVYFILPNENNVKVLSADLANGLYESYYLNFISNLGRPLLEDLATCAVQNSCVAQVNKVFDQYVNFICLEDNLFTLRRHTEHCAMSYYGLNRADMDEHRMNTAIDDVVDGLFSVCVTLGQVPIIRCPRGQAAEQVAERLDRRIRDNLRDARNNLFASENIRAGQVNFARPLLVIADRTLDLATMLHHTWTYQALVHDVLELDSNRVVIGDTPPSTGTPTSAQPGKQREYDMNAHDKFWGANKGRPFPEVAEAVQTELEAYRASESEIKRMKDAMGLDADSDEAISMLSESATAKLTSTVSSLPELLERKRLIDQHTNVATAVLESIKHRKLDVYFELEEKLMNGTPADISQVLKDSESGSADDKLRLFLIYYITTLDLNEEDLQSLLSALDTAGCDKHAYKYVKRWKSFAKMLTQDHQSGGSTKTVSMFSKLLNHSSQLVMDGVKNLVIKKHNLPITKVVDALMEMKSLPEVDDYRYFDPKLLRSNDSGTARQRTPFSEAIVFVIGGGNYVEYQNIQDYTTSKNAAIQNQSALTNQATQALMNSSSFGQQKKSITYGCTDLVNADQFLAQLSKLGTEM